VTLPKYSFAPSLNVSTEELYGCRNDNRQGRTSLTGMPVAEIALDGSLTVHSASIATFLRDMAAAPQ
jgi:hypothetical protein